MRRNWFVVFLICAICSKFILNWLLITGIFAAILGVKKEERNTLKTIVFGLTMGLESAVILNIFSASRGLSVFLGLFRSIGLPIADGFSYASVSFMAFAYIVIFELIFVVLVVRLTEILLAFIQKKGTDQSNEVTA